MYLGIDQSLRSSGVAVVSPNKETIYVGRVTPGKLTGVARLACIRDALLDVIGAQSDILFAALEGYAYDVGAGKVFELGELGGVVKMLLHEVGVPFVVVPPASLKLFVASNGSASKELMRQAVLQKWGTDLAQDDECDAFGLAHVARAVHKNTGTTRAELEVVKKLNDTSKKISLVSSPAKTLSI